MANLQELRKAADELSREERAGLAAHLLASFPSAPRGPDDDELDRRESEMDSSVVNLLNEEDFRAAVGRE